MSENTVLMKGRAADGKLSLVFCKDIFILLTFEIKINRKKENMLLSRFVAFYLLNSCHSRIFFVSLQGIRRIVRFVKLHGITG